MAHVAIFMYVVVTVLTENVEAVRRHHRIFSPGAENERVNEELNN